MHSPTVSLLSLLLLLASTSLAESASSVNVTDCGNDLKLGGSNARQVLVIIASFNYRQCY